MAGALPSSRLPRGPGGAWLTRSPSPATRALQLMWPRECAGACYHSASLTRSLLDAYYEQTWLDYRWFWLNQRNAAMHFGYWGRGIRRHGQSLLAMNRVMANAAGVRRGD